MKGVMKKIGAVLIIASMLIGYMTFFANRKASNPVTENYPFSGRDLLIEGTKLANTSSYYDCSGFIAQVLKNAAATQGGSLTFTGYGNGYPTAETWNSDSSVTFTYTKGSSQTTYGVNKLFSGAASKSNGEAWTTALSRKINLSSLQEGDIISGEGHMILYIGYFADSNGDGDKGQGECLAHLQEITGISSSDMVTHLNQYSGNYWYIEGNIGSGYSQTNASGLNQPVIGNYEWSDSSTEAHSWNLNNMKVYRLSTEPVVVQDGSYQLKLGKVSSENLSTYMAGAVFNVNDTSFTTQTSAVTVANKTISAAGSDTYVFEETQAPADYVKHDGLYALQVTYENVNNTYVVTKVHYYSGSGSNLKQGDITSSGKYWINANRDLVADSSMSDTDKKSSIAYIDASNNLAEIVYVGLNTPDSIGKTVRKVWRDGENQYNTRPQSIEVQLYKNGTAEGSQVTLNSSNNWEYTWEGLPRTSGGTEISYEIREVGTVKGYTTASQTSGNTTTLTNTLNEEQPEVRAGEIGLYKYEDTDGNGKYDTGEPSIEGAEFKIATSEENARNNVFVKDTTGNDIVAISGKDGTAKFENLTFDEQTLANAAYTEVDETTGVVYHKYHWDQVATTYYIKETKAPEGYREITDIISADAKVDYYNVRDITSLVQVGNIKKIYDLALRKFITEVQDGFTGEKSKIILNLDDKEEISRVPEVDLKDLKSGKSTTATYNHIKTPVLVHTTDIVTYTLQIYNEGPEDAYASIIKDDIPQGLEFVPYKEGDGSVNETYRWKMVDENDKEVTDAKKAKYIVTDYLAMDENEENLIKAYDPDTMTELDSRFVKVQFKVTEPTTSKRIVTNSAQISKETDVNGKVVIDRDSTPNEWLGEDDEDVEHVRVLYFDLALRKWVTHAIVTEKGETKVIETGHHAEDDPEEIVKVDLKKSKLEDITVKFKYSIRITNQGEIPGEATEIRDDIPEGLEFVQEDNPDWRVENGKVVTNKLEKTTLKPGESAEVEIILTWIKSKDNMGVKINVAEINKDHNNYGTNDIDSTPGNNKKDEDDIDDAPVMLTITTGSEIIKYAGLGLAVFVIVTLGAVSTKKILKK